MDLSPTNETLPCRKWGYGGKNVVINDAIVVGAQKSCTFDHLLTARYFDLAFYFLHFTFSLLVWKADFMRNTKVLRHKVHW